VGMDRSCFVCVLADIHKYSVCGCSYVSLKYESNHKLVCEALSLPDKMGKDDRDGFSYLAI